MCICKHKHTYLCVCICMYIFCMSLKEYLYIHTHTLLCSCMFIMVMMNSRKIQNVQFFSPWESATTLQPWNFEIHRKEVQAGAALLYPGTFDNLHFWIIHCACLYMYVYGCISWCIYIHTYLFSAYVDILKFQFFFFFFLFFLLFPSTQQKLLS